MSPFQAIIIQVNVNFNEIVIRFLKGVIFVFFFFIFTGLISKNVVLIAQSGRDTVIQSVRRSECKKKCLKICCNF